MRCAIPAIAILTGLNSIEMTSSTSASVSTPACTSSRNSFLDTFHSCTRWSPKQQDSIQNPVPRLKYVGLMWSLFLIRHLYLIVYTARVVVTNGHLNHTCYNEIGLCAQNIDTIMGEKINAIGRANVIVWKERVCSVWPLMSFASELQFSNLKPKS